MNASAASVAPIGVTPRPVLANGPRFLVFGQSFPVRLEYPNPTPLFDRHSRSAVLFVFTFESLNKLVGLRLGREVFAFALTGF